MSENELKFKVSVPYNSKYLVKKRKKHNLINGIMFAGFYVFFFVLFVLCNSSNNEGMLAIKIILGIFMIFTLAMTIFFLIKDETKLLNKDSSLDFLFMENTFSLARSNKKTVMENCLYQKKMGMQYITKVIETNDLIIFKILKGYYNFAPQYVKHYLPKEALGEKELAELIEFLKSKLGERYTTE